MHYPTDRIAHTTAFVTSVVRALAWTRNSSMDTSVGSTLRMTMNSRQQQKKGYRGNNVFCFFWVAKKKVYSSSQWLCWKIKFCFTVIFLNRLGSERFDQPHWTISHSNQCSTTGATKGVVCPLLCGMVYIKEPLLLIKKD